VNPCIVRMLRIFSSNIGLYDCKVWFLHMCVEYTNIWIYDCRITAICAASLGIDVAAVTG
jgi:hypothetical protein